VPNWCLNKVLIKVPNDNLLKKLRNALGNEIDPPTYIRLGDGRIVTQGAPNLFNQLVPRPNAIAEGDNFWKWEMDNWGVKGDATPRDIYWPDEYTVNFEILTAWGPPLAFFENIERMGYLVNGYYLEELTCLLGVYYEGNNDTYEYSELSPDQMETELPSWVNQLFSLIDNKRIEEQANTEGNDADLVQALEDLKKEYENLTETKKPKSSKK